MNELGHDMGFSAPRRPTEVVPTVLSTEGDGKSRVEQLDIGELLRVLLKRKWLVAASLALGIAVAIGVTMTSTRIYRASVTLDINTSQMAIMGNERQVQQRPRNEDAFLQTQYGLIKSRSLAARVERTLALADDPTFVPQQMPQERRELAATFKLMRGLEVQPVRGSHLVKFYYDDVNPDRATRIANAFGTGFIASGAARRFEATAYARSFLQSRLNLTRERLEASERQLVGYAQTNGILQLDHAVDPGLGGRKGDGPSGSGGDTLSSQSLTTLNAALANAIGERIAAEQRYKQALANSSSGELLTSPTVQALRTERNKLEADYREQRATFQPDYPAMISLSDRIAQVDKAMARETGDVSSSLRSAYLSALGREAELRDQVDRLRGQVLQLRGRGIGYTILQREVDTNRALYDALLERFKEIDIIGGLGESDAEIVDTALPPHSPFEPRPFRNLLAGLLAGLVLGLAATFAIEFIDDTIKTPEDARTKLRLPLLGMVPNMARTALMIEQLASPRSDIAEAYYSVTTALQFSSRHGFPGSLVVTSSRPGEGKSSTSLALAQNFARIGKSVLLIDADLRNPSFLNKDTASIGLSALLVSMEAIDAHIMPTRTPGLSLLPSGPIPPNPAELLVGNRIHAIIAEAKERFDIVIVDAPPVLGLADAPILGSACEAVVLIVEAGSIRRRIALNALERLTSSDARIAGVVLTKCDFQSAGYGYGYGFGYAYGRSGKAAADRQSALLDIAS